MSKVHGRNYGNQIKPLGKKLKAILFQLPPSFDYKPENLQENRRYEEVHTSEDLNIVFEFQEQARGSYGRRV